LTAPAAEAIPTERWPGSAQLNVVVRTPPFSP
jgi:hypothetical protein